MKIRENPRILSADGDKKSHLLQESKQKMDRLRVTPLYKFSTASTSNSRPQGTSSLE